MATILYKVVNGETVSESCNPLDVSNLLKSGYTTSPAKAVIHAEIDTNDTGKLSNAEIKDAAREAGIRIGRKSINTLKTELGL